MKVSGMISISRAAPSLTRGPVCHTPKEQLNELLSKREWQQSWELCDQQELSKFVVIHKAIYWLFALTLPVFDNATDWLLIYTFLVVELNYTWGFMSLGIVILSTYQQLMNIYYYMDTQNPVIYFMALFGFAPMLRDLWFRFPVPNKVADIASQMKFMHVLSEGLPQSCLQIYILLHKIYNGGDLSNISLLLFSCSISIFSTSQVFDSWHRNCFYHPFYPNQWGHPWYTVPYYFFSTIGTFGPIAALLIRKELQPESLVLFAVWLLFDQTCATIWWYRNVPLPIWMTLVLSFLATLGRMLSCVSCFYLEGMILNKVLSAVLSSYMLTLDTKGLLVTQAYMFIAFCTFSSTVMMAVGYCIWGFEVNSLDKLSEEEMVLAESFFCEFMCRSFYPPWADLSDVIPTEAHG